MTAAESRQQDLEQLTALSDEDSSIKPFIPVDLSDNDPLTIIAGWLESDNKA